MKLLEKLQWLKISGLLILLAALLSACATPVTPQQPLSPREYFNKGLAAFQQWEGEQQLGTLFLAERYLDQASSEFADNAQWQNYYYRSLYMLSALDWNFWHVRLEQQHSQLNSLVKADLYPPAFLEYLLHEESSGDQRKQQLLFKALKQHPGSHPAWYHLSLLYQQWSQLELALYAALTAEKYSVDVANVNFQVGSLYHELASAEACSYEYPQLDRQAVKYLARAASLKPDDPAFQHSLAGVYNHIGLFPLALQVAKQAADLERNGQTVYELARAHFGMGDYDDADSLYYEMLLNHQALGNESLVAAAIVDSRWADAISHAEVVVAVDIGNVYFYAMTRWLQKLANVEGLEMMWQPNDPWESLLLDYVSNMADHKPDTLINAAGTVCQSTKAHFYTAMRWWFNDKPDVAKTHLETVLSLKNYSYPEYQWAQAMLLSEMFTAEK